MRIEVNGVRLFVDVDGPEWVVDGDRMRRRPVLVMLHGGPGLDHAGFKHDLPTLPDLAQVVYIDHRGNGRSDRADADTWTLDQWADDVRAVCDHLGLDSPIVMGQSFGGFVAQAYAARHPDHPAGLILSSTAGRFRMERNLAVFERLGGAQARASAEAFYLDPTLDTAMPFFADCMPL
ncbi:MAG: alpha/beta fold hydrolase [Acidimicrobiales bacterium]